MDLTRYMPATLPQGSARIEQKEGGPPNAQPRAVQPEFVPLTAVVAVCDVVRDEHGRRGIGAFLAAAEPFLPRELVEQAAAHFDIPAPKCMVPQTALEPPPQKKNGPEIPPELLLQLLQGGGGLDPAMLLKLMK